MEDPLEICRRESKLFHDYRYIAELKNLYGWKATLEELKEAMLDNGFQLEGEYRFRLDNQGYLDLFVHYEPDDGENGIGICGIWATEIGKGYGTNILTKSLSIADAIKASPIFLCPKPFDLDSYWNSNTKRQREGAMNEEQLRIWYSRHGFQNCTSSHRMVRLAT